MSKLLQWDEIYCFQKFLPLLTRWQLFHRSNTVNVSADPVQLNGCLSPAFIKKKRAPKGVASYEIIWEDDQNCFTGLIPDEQLNVYMEQNSLNDLQHLWSTIEPQDLVERAYPSLVEAFLAPKLSTKAKRTKKVAAAAPTDDATNKAKKPATRQKRPKANENQPPTANGNMLIDRFFKKTKTARKPAPSPPPVSHQSPKIQTSALPMHLSNFSIDFEDGDAFDEHDLSGAIRDIVARPPHATELFGRKLRFEEIADHDDAQTDSANVSFDEFDLMVLNRATQLQDASTPIQAKRKTKGRQRAKRQSLKLNQIACDGGGLKAGSEDSGAIVNCHFFGDITASVDAFEQSLDLHNMPDEFEEQPLHVDENDTFGLENYVPVGAKLGKKFRGKIA